MLSTAALMVDGCIVACVSEERFSRNKNDESYPKKSIEYCLEYAGIDGADLDQVVIGTFEADLWHQITRYYSNFSIEDFVREQYDYWYPTLYENKKIAWHHLYKDKWDLDQYPGNWHQLVKQLDDSYHLSSDNTALINAHLHETISNHIGIPKEKIQHIDHHAAHAAYAFWASPFRDCDTLVLTLDAYGDGLSATISVTENQNVIKRIKAIDHRDFQLGRMYRYATLLLGMKPNEHEYKVMGLGAYAKPKIYEKPYQIYKNTMYVDGLDFAYHERPQDMYFYFDKKMKGCRFDGIAGALQRYSEDILTEWVSNALKHTQTSHLVVSGGVAMNVKAMKCLSELPSVKDMFVSPSGSDESLAMGACYHFCKTHYGVDPTPLNDTYLGPDLTDVAPVVRQARSKHPEYMIYENVDPDFVAEKLSNNRVIARCAGRMEFGARSLGNRSILANPQSAQIVRTINEKVKNRDFWMPFAPTVLSERVPDYLQNPKNIDAPFMTIAFDTTEKGADELVAGTHNSDRTARPQMLKPSRNAEYHKLIKAFEKRTGIGGILNTSFNLHGEPIVCSAEDALRVFELTDIDDLLLDGVLISKSE